MTPAVTRVRPTYSAVNDGATWSEVEKLVANDTNAGDEFGFNVAISGSLIVVGAAFDNANRDISGAAYVFRNVDDGVLWSEVDKLVASAPIPFSYFGASVAIAGNLIVVGALYDDVGARAGSAYVFRSVDDGVSWSEMEKLVASDGGAEDNFGESVAISGNFIVIGTPSDDAGGDGSGPAYVFRSADDGVSWSEMEKLVASDAAEIEFFGRDVAISDDLVIAGAPQNADVGNLSARSVYVFGIRS